MACKKIRPALLVTLALQQFCSPVFAQNSLPQQSEVTSTKTLPIVNKTIKKPVKKRITSTLKNKPSEQTITAQPLPESTVEARQAILRSQFKPHIEDGKAIAVYTIVPITFHLDN